MRKLDTVDSGLKDVLWSILDEIERNREESVTKKEFLELHEIVRQLGQSAQELTQSHKELVGIWVGYPSA